MGKRADVSARTVIAGDPNLHINQVGVMVGQVRTFFSTEFFLIALFVISYDRRTKSVKKFFQKTNFQEIRFLKFFSRILFFSPNTLTKSSTLVGADKSDRLGLP